MNRHQVLTGAANIFENSVAVGSVGHNHFTTYGSGRNLIILSSNFDRVQIISSSKHNSDAIIRCIDCTLDTGKIAAAYSNTVFIFEPTPSAKKATHNIHYKWIEVGVIELESDVECVSWNNDGQRILIGCSIGTLQIWTYNPNADTKNTSSDKKKEDSPVKFSICDEIDNLSSNEHKQSEEEQNPNIFIKIWESKIVDSIKFVKFSPDGSFFASYGHNDRLVKIWHESTNYLDSAKLDYNFIYLAHPRAVTCLSWRQISKFMPRGMVSNSLITCCKDNICRIWTETVLPDDGLTQHSHNPSSSASSSMVDSDPSGTTNIHSSSATNSFLTNSKSVRHKKKLFHKLQKMRISTHFPHFSTKPVSLNTDKATNIHNAYSSNSNLSFLTSMGSNQLYASTNTEQAKSDKSTTIPTSPQLLQSAASTSELLTMPKIVSGTAASHYQQSISRAFHFHLAGLIDPDASCIPLHLLPNLNQPNSKDSKNFVVHWMQNKDFHFTYTAELFSKEIYQKLKKIYAQQKTDSNSWSCEDLTQSEQTSSSSSSSAAAAAADSASDFTLDSLLNINLDDETKNLLFDNSIDQKLDQMLKDWFDSHDVLFCIHPLDGSVLIWLVDWLDENMPGNIYRQAQVSFHAKIPHSFPIGDSSSLTNCAFLYMEPVMSNLEKPELDNEYFYEAGCVNLVSKHSNGTLNLWRIQFQDNSKYQSLVNVSHLYRVCGHRFKVSDITSHPILPFLLTNSINDLNTQQKQSFQMGQSEDSQFYAKYQKGIVIWGVEPVGPLCKSGGIFELARIDSSKPNAFENIAWFPCFLPSSTLGTSSASPSTLFASTDASQITIYQAVFDARTLLHECSKTSAKVTKATTNSSISSCVSSGDSFIGVSNTTEIGNNNFNIVSIQSTARPGCIIELEKLVDSSMSTWTKADLFHIYQENLINDEAKVTLNSNNQFEESYFLVLLEKKRNVLSSKNVKIVEIVHMWKISISSMAQNSDETKNRLTIKSTRVCQQELNLPDHVYVSCAATAAADLASSAMFCQNKVAYLFTTACSDGIVRFWSCKAKSEEEYEFFEWKPNENTSSEVNLNGVFPLTIACSYTSRFAVACKQRLKNVKASKKNAKVYFVKIYECESSGGSEWKLEDTICLKNIVLPEIDSGIDFDYIFGNSQPIRPARSTHSFKNILFGSSNLPSSTSVSASVSQPNAINNTNTANSINSANGSCHPPCHLASIPSSNSFAMFTNVDSADLPLNAKTPEIPSTAAKISIKRQFSNNPNDQQHKPDSLNSSIQSRSVNCKFKNTSLIKLDWASNENGSHILTIGVGNKILVYSCSNKINLPQNQSDSLENSSDVNWSDVNWSDMNWSEIERAHSHSFLKWTEVRSFELDSADDQQALPTQMKWVREGLLVIGLNTEMQVYSQWSPITNKHTLIHEETNDENENLKNLILISKNASVLDLNKLNLQLSKEMNSGKHSHFADKNKTPTRNEVRKKIFDEGQALELVQDSGLFMHANNVCPTLPQYHPKQLVELMNSGKVKQAKAILLHLTRCIIDNEFKIKNDTKINSAEKKLKKRKMSVTNELQLPEEHVLNFLQIESIPPLPLFQLYSADDKVLKSVRPKLDKDHDKDHDKNDLFSQHHLLDSSEAIFSSDDMNELFIDEDQKQKQAEQQEQKQKLDFKKKLLLESDHEFEKKACNLLIEYLQFVQLNGLTSTDQMYLVALADTIVNLNCDLKTSKSGDQSTQANVVDDCAFKFLLSLRSYNYLVRTLPNCLKTSLKSIGLGSANFAWAFHSECQQDLLNQIISADEHKFNFTWTNLKQYGVGWWLKTPAILKQLVERIAKFSYQQNNDPLDSALFYLAMKKKGVLCALFKTGKDMRMNEFFKNDFNEPKWQTAALKNAFVLLGKQRFEHAAAFFLLANRVKDAIEVCLRNLNDIQLALILVRLYFETDFEQQNNLIEQILKNEILNGKCADPFLRSMSFWFVKDYKNALNTLFNIDIDHLDILKSSSGISCLSANSKDSMISHVFNFYNFLKSHPLVLRQELNQNHSINNNNNNISNNISNISTLKHKEVSSIERRLHFIAAFYHLINGCPLLSLDILRRLPKYVSAPGATEKEANIEESRGSSNANLSNDDAFTSNFEDNKAAKVEQKATLIDWSTSNLDLFSNRIFKDEQLELDLELDLKLSDSDEHDHSESNADELDVNKSEQKVDKSTNETHTFQQQQQQQDSNKIVDTFSQQLKFISCLKILIEEMSNLANGFEVIGGQLRYYMYYWLDRETKLLRELGDYKDHEITSLISFEEDFVESSHILDEKKTCNKTSSLLHEEVLNDQVLFQQKIKRLNNRKIWLRSNELLLRTLLSYCSLHSASAQGLISVKMELLLLMQELIEDRSSTVKQLYEPMPIHTTTTIPLLSATIASSKNMLAGPIQMLRRLETDLLSTISSMSIFPTIFDFPIVITTIKEISVSLSSCIYQCLCDSDNVLYRINEDARQTDNSSSLNNIGIEELSRNILYRSVSIIKDDSNEIKNNGRKKICSNKIAIQSQPKNWPGISNLNKLLDRNNEDLEFPKLKILLFESLVAVFASLLLNALVFYDCSNLYRILSKEWKDKMWNKLFGGAATIEFKYKFSSNSVSLDDENQKQRIRMNTRLGHRLNSNVSSNNQSFVNQTNINHNNVASDERVYLREKFIPPEISMINYFLNKDDSESELSDSNSSNFDESDIESDTFKKDAYDEDFNQINEKNKLEHMNPKSYSWFLMRFAILKYSLHCITSFLTILGIEPNEIATLSPLIHQVMKTFEKWMKLLLIEMNSIHKDGPPQDFIKLDSNILDSDAANNFNGPKILKYQLILDPNNTPFINDKSSFGARRLWNFLVNKKCLHEFFMRQIFKRNQVSNNLSNKTGLNETNDNLLKKSEIQNESTHLNNYTKALKIIHKDQETINSFCINERSKNTLALCTNKEIIEIDVGDLLIKNTSKTIEDDYQVDINAFNSQQGFGKQVTDQDVYVIGEFGLNFQNQNYALLAEQKLALNPGNAKNLRLNTLGNMTLKRNTKDVRKLASHPTLPYYLSGTGDSIVKLWHWGSQDALSTIKQQEKINSSSKITQILFNSHGNKFGVSDIDGYLHLYQLLGCSFKPYLTMRCQKVINDFIFVESSSILLTVGTVNDSFVISLWDTLMPSNKSLVKSFKEQDVPSGTCASYSLLNHLAYCGTRKGDVYVYDIRTHKKLSKFMAHESCVKTMALNSDEYLLATGSSEGSVKVWNLRTCDIKYSFPNEHSKSSLIRSFNSGVNQLRFTGDNQLLSCGADGTLGIRNLN